MNKKLVTIVSTLLSIIIITICVYAYFTYVYKLNTGNININSPTIEVLDNTSKSITEIKWLDEFNEEVSTFNSNSTYHTNKVIIKNTSNSYIELEFSLSSSNIENIGDYLTLTYSGIEADGYIGTGMSVELIFYVTIKDDVDNDFGGKEIQDLSIVITSKEYTS